MFQDLFTSVDTTDIKFVLNNYVADKRIIRLSVGQSQLLLRVHQVGNSMFHASIIDPGTRTSRGNVHLPLSIASSVFCLDEDNPAYKLEQLLTLKTPI
jgi:hypothetical protein